MKKSSLFSRVLILILSLSLSLPMSVFADKKVDTKKAKKNFNEGIKYEALPFVLRIHFRLQYKMPALLQQLYLKMLAAAV